ncbi:hypothetical protein [Moritella viscosa]|uniref:Uncharacterized protein n=1 Tax=Moritella viscosa TaxID=80854 RepID=A0A090IIF9_9GAMM|nr:hypothetical protein [Moritella viscosa]CED59869.1 putative exported protein [Moritella viscosa]SGY87300.1 Putative uncharacterized protein [Moritella viscosa]SGY90377.1 Putative uncharacterized protein [Moritella viscosa]SGY90386.1 Putative uncharacterized protein [Moritella viscosa]SGY92942.1 Putative uncharacterized protein [Moritella viscosa]
MFISILFKRLLKVILCSSVVVSNASAWSEHSLITYPILKTIPDVADQVPIKVETLAEFVTAEAQGLETLLASNEDWLRQNVLYYKPRPDTLAFDAAGQDLQTSFTHAIRINPNARVNPYIQLLPGQDKQGRRRMDSSEVTVFKSLDHYNTMTFVEVKSGEMVTPIEVLVSANDDPDNGLDIGLFEDSNTNAGKLYGFGKQAFGNPALEYSSQAPFHMGFYHESSVLFTLAPFLRDTFPDYRVHMYKALSEYAFRTGHDYWGWRFMGWGMHYIGDIAQSYHSTLQPGVSTVSSIWTNAKDMMGFPQAKIDAIQLLSNRHLVLETFQENITKQAYENNDFSSILFKALEQEMPVIEYTNTTFVEVFAKKSYDKSQKLADYLERWVPEKLVSDPSFEVDGSKEVDMIVDMIREKNGEEGVTQMINLLAEFMSDHNANTRSYVRSILYHKP